MRLYKADKEIVLSDVPKEGYKECKLEGCCKWFQASLNTRRKFCSNECLEAYKDHCRTIRRMELRGETPEGNRVWHIPPIPAADIAMFWRLGK